MNKKNYSIAVVLLVIAIIIGCAIYIWNGAETASQSEPAENSSITVKGVIGCLEPKDKSGVQDLSCAIGLKADNGKSYGLSATDPSSIGSLPSGQRVEIKGAFMKQDSKYDSVGTIQVATVRQQ